LESGRAFQEFAHAFQNSVTHYKFQIPDSKFVIAGVFLTPFSGAARGISLIRKRLPSGTRLA
jgi:hypothetical protein